MQQLIVFIFYLLAGGASYRLVKAMYPNTLQDPGLGFFVVAIWPAILPICFGFWSMGLILKLAQKR